MKKLLKILLIAAAVLLLGLGLVFVLVYGPSFGIYLKKPTPQEYVQQAVGRMDSLGLYADTEAWRSAREQTLRDAAGLSSYKEAYPLLETALKAVGGKHSKLIVPGGEGQADVTPQMPEWEMRPDGILLLRLPAFTGDGKAAAAYAEAGSEALRQYADGIKGVILDLRGNTGGDMGPMVAAVSPLLEDGELMHFNVKGAALPVMLQDGCVTGGGSTVRLKEPFKLSGVPVALLQDGMTASSGEATLLCFRGLDHAKTFGTPSAGYCSSNNVIKLYDGATMLLTMGTDVARTGEEFCEEPIAPDEATDTPTEAAAAWILAFGNDR